MSSQSDIKTESTAWLATFNPPETGNDHFDKLPPNIKHLSYAVILTSVFWLGVLFLSHLIW